MVDVLIFSKDRNMQLNALLRSIKKYVPHIYNSITVEYAIGERFEQNVLKWLDNAGELISFLVDDDVFYRYSPKPTEYPFSFRLGFNTSWCHPRQMKQKIPSTIPFLWRLEEGDFGYPISLDGTIYKKDTIVSLLHDLTFMNPTQLEAGLAERSNNFKPERIYMSEHSSLVSLPHNRVTTSSLNPISNNTQWTIDKLNYAFSLGQRIDLNKMDFSNITSCHQEIDLVFTNV